MTCITGSWCFFTCALVAAKYNVATLAAGSRGARAGSPNVLRVASIFFRLPVTRLVLECCLL